MSEPITTEPHLHAGSDGSSPGVSGSDQSGQPHTQSPADRLAAAKRRLSGFDQPDEPREERRSRRPGTNAQAERWEDDRDEQPLVWKVVDATADHLKEHYRSYLIGLGTGAALLGLKSSRLRKTLFAAGMQLGAANLTGWFGNDDAGDEEDDSDMPRKPKKTGGKKPSRRKSSSSSRASGSTRTKGKSKGGAAKKASSSASRSTGGGTATSSKNDAGPETSVASKDATSTTPARGADGTFKPSGEKSSGDKSSGVKSSGDKS